MKGTGIANCVLKVDSRNQEYSYVRSPAGGLKSKIIKWKENTDSKYVFDVV